jgi:hypothetical protein
MCVNDQVIVQNNDHGVLKPLYKCNYILKCFGIVFKKGSKITAFLTKIFRLTPYLLQTQ